MTDLRHSYQGMADTGADNTVQEYIKGSVATGV
jgi:hypothetical protein